MANRAGQYAEYVVEQYRNQIGNRGFHSGDPIGLANFIKPQLEALGDNRTASQILGAVLRNLRHQYGVSGKQEESFRLAFRTSMPSIFDERVTPRRPEADEGKFLPTPDEFGITEGEDFAASQALSPPDPSDAPFMAPKPDTSSAKRSLVIATPEGTFDVAVAKRPARRKQAAPGGAKEEQQVQVQPVQVQAQEQIQQSSVTQQPMSDLERRARQVLEDPGSYQSIMGDIEKLLYGLSSEELSVITDKLLTEGGAQNIAVNVASRWASAGFNPASWSPKLLKGAYSIDINKARQRQRLYGTTDTSSLQEKQIESPFLSPMQGVEQGLREWYTQPAPPTSVANLMQQYDEYGIMREMGAPQRWENLQGYEQANTNTARSYLDSLLQRKEQVGTVSFQNMRRSGGSDDDAGGFDFEDDGSDNFLSSIAERVNESALQTAQGAFTATDIKNNRESLLKGNNASRQLLGSYWMDFWSKLPESEAKKALANPMALPLDAWISLMGSVGAKPGKDTKAKNVNNLTQFGRLIQSSPGAESDPEKYRAVLGEIKSQIEKDKEKAEKAREKGRSPKLAKLVPGYDPAVLGLISILPSEIPVDTKPQADADRIFTSISANAGKIPRNFLGAPVNVLASIGGGEKSDQETLNMIEFELAQRRQKNPGPKRADMDLAFVAETLREPNQKKRKKKLSPATRKALRKKAKMSGVDYDILRDVYSRGVAAYYATGSRAQKGPQQWAYARVNSFLKGGKTRFTADRDLAEEAGLVAKRKDNPGFVEVEGGDKATEIYLRQDGEDIIDALLKADKTIHDATVDYLGSHYNTGKDSKASFDIYGQDEETVLKMDAWGESLLDAIRSAQEGLAEAADQYTEYLMKAQEDSSREINEQAVAFAREMQENADKIMRTMNPALPPMDTTWSKTVHDEVMITDFCDGNFFDGLRAMDRDPVGVLELDMHLASLGADSILSEEDIEMFCELFDMDPEDFWEED